MQRLRIKYSGELYNKNLSVGGRLTRKHLLHVDLALLKKICEPLTVLELGSLLQAKQEKRKVVAILEWMSQFCHTDQLSNDGSCCKLG